MSDQVKTEQRDALALIQLARAPSNVLTPALRQALSAELTTALENPKIKAVVLAGAGQGFCSGVDLSEYAGALADPWVNTLCTQIEMSDKPVVAALHGAVMGAGFELALAAHARVAHVKTRLAMPDIKLNMIPGGGATQRLPRILGAQVALELLLSGQTVYASDPRLNRLMSQITEDTPLEAACHLAQRLTETGSWRRTRDDDRGFRDPEGYQHALSSLRRQINSDKVAAVDILRCVEAAQLLPFEQGLEFEQSLFQERLAAPEARSARHILMAERYAAQPPKVSPGSPVIRRVALYGSRDRLGDLALELLAHSVHVAMVTAGPSEAAAFDAWIARTLQGQVKKGALGEAEVSHRMGLLDSRSGPQALAQADLVFDDGSLPSRALPELQPHAIWTLLGREHRPEARATQLGLKKPLLSLHLWAPITTRAVAEITFGGKQEMADFAGLMSTLGRIGKSPLLTKARAGEIEHRLSGAVFRAGLGLLALGVQPSDVDAAARRIGFEKGPCHLMDQTGLPKVQAMIDRSANCEAELKLLTAFIAAGRNGQSEGRGLFSYQTGQPLADETATRLLPNPSMPNLSARQLESAILGGLVNAAAQIMDAELLRRASDIDLAMVKGMGFERVQGGPLLQADFRGLFSVYKVMRELGKRVPFWVPHKRVETMVKNGDGFYGRSTVN